MVEDPDDVYSKRRQRATSSRGLDTLASLSDNSSDTRLADLEERIKALEGELEQRLEDGVTKATAEATDWVSSLVDSAERRLELQASAIDEALVVERDRIDAALGKLAKVRRSAKQEVNAMANLESRLRDDMGAEASNAANDALGAHLASESKRLERRLEKLAKRAQKQLSDRASELVASLDVAAAEANNRLVSTIGEAERTGAGLRESVSGAVKRIDTAAENALTRLKDEAAEATRERATLDAAIAAQAERVDAAAGKLTRKATMQEAKLARAERGKWLEGAKRSLSEDGARLRDELERLLASGAQEGARALAAFQEQTEQLVSERQRESISKVEQSGAQGAEALVRVRAEAEAALTAAAAAAEQGVREASADAARQAAAAVAREHATELMGELLENVREAESASMQRIAGEAEAAAKRLEEVDRAQERDARVRAATSDAQRESETRVREAEQQLLEVLAQISEVEAQIGHRSVDPV